MFNMGYGCRIVVSFSFRTSLRIVILLECDLFTRTVRIPYCDILAGGITSSSLFSGILFKDTNMVSNESVKYLE